MEQRLLWRMVSICNRLYFTNRRLSDVMERTLWYWAGKRGLRFFDPDTVVAVLSSDGRPVQLR